MIFQLVLTSVIFVFDLHVFSNAFATPIFYLVAVIDFVPKLRNLMIIHKFVGGRLGCCDHEMVEFRILHGGSRAVSRIKTLDLRRADFGLFKELLEGIP